MNEQLLFGFKWVLQTIQDSPPTAYCIVWMHCMLRSSSIASKTAWYSIVPLALLEITPCQQIKY